MTAPSFDLTGRSAVVTGARRGIGRAMAEALAGAGADIIGVSRAMEPDGGAVGAAVRAAGRRFTAIACDFADRAAVHALGTQILDDIGLPDILINNAGTIQRAPGIDHSDAMWDEVIEVNLNAQFVLTRQIGAAMVRRGSGKVVFTASLLTFQGGFGVPSYAASKGAIGQLTMALANEWAPHGVNVNAIAPGYIDTDITEVIQRDPTRAPAILQRIPAGRWGKPQDFAGPAVFLSSDASDYVHGTILTVDGGWMGR